MLWFSAFPEEQPPQLCSHRSDAFCLRANSSAFFISRCELACDRKDWASEHLLGLDCSTFLPHSDCFRPNKLYSIHTHRWVSELGEVGVLNRFGTWDTASLSQAK